MVGIENIGSYIPTTRVSNYDRKGRFGVEDLFLEQKLGIVQVAVKDPEEHASDLAVKAFQALFQKTNLENSHVQCLILVTQNPDYNLPHTAALVHGRLDLPVQCACFDVSLGCSGFVYGLSLMESFLERNHLRCGVLITADPYSSIVDQNDKNTALLFGDAATATLVSGNPRFKSGKFTFGTLGRAYGELICREGRLFMNGRAIFDFAARQIPTDIELLLKENGQDINNVDKFIFHQASKYIIQTIVSRLRIDPQKASFAAGEYGNTVSSSIPILLEKELDDIKTNIVVISGFGVGLSWASGILYRTNA